jgi:hypothetical protein
MKRIALAACLFAATSAAFAQISLAMDGAGSRPQIAYRLFSSWVDENEREAGKGKGIAISLLFTGGGLALGGAIATFAGGDKISQSVSGQPMEPLLKQNLVIGLGIASAGLYTAGFLVAASKAPEYRRIYSDVFGEPDPDVQEAMAVSILRYQADKGKEKRIASFISALALPLITGGIRASINLSKGDPWADGVFDSIKGQSWSIASGLVSLVSKTPEERLYERYLATRDALYGIPSRLDPPGAGR